MTRRRIYACVAALALCGAALSIFLASRSKHVVVVKVLIKKHPSETASVSTPREYPAADGAPSLGAVRADLKRVESKGGRTGSGVSSSSAAPLPVSSVASFARLSGSLPGTIELAVTTLGAGGTSVLGRDLPAHGWSTTKVPVLVALLKARGRRGLTASETELAHSAITESNNESILALFSDLERLKGGLDGASRYIQTLFRDSGDGETVVTTAPPPAGAATTFGQTEWRPSDAVKFFRALALGCLLPHEQTSYVLGLMEHIVASESWGLGSAGFGSVAFKGGWGPEPSGNYLVRQSGVIDVGSTSGVAVSIVAFPSSGSFSAGTEMLTQTADWLGHELRLVPRAPAGCSG
jgi:hypothetical protein